tara:strand:- start:195 stop:542 length:348 start_codon:yes stop_codon:yes gene_type:complete
LNIPLKILTGIFAFLAILIAFSIKKDSSTNVREIGRLGLNNIPKIGIWKNSIRYRYKKTALDFLSLSKIYKVQVWKKGLKKINYFSNKDLQKELKPKIYTKNFKINIWGNVFNKE